MLSLAMNMGKDHYPPTNGLLKTIHAEMLRTMLVLDEVFIRPNIASFNT